MLTKTRTIVSVLAVALVGACAGQGQKVSAVATTPPPAGNVPAAIAQAVTAANNASTPVPAAPGASSKPPEKEWKTLKPTPAKTIEAGGVHDMQNQSTPVLQNPTEALVSFPVDRLQAIDWVAALKQGLYTPRPSVKGDGQMTTMDLDIIMKETAGMPRVRFPHQTHSQLLDCSNCHDGIFIPQTNANPVTMAKILKGEYCGVCHGIVAFSSFVCERCHSVPLEGQKKWW